MIRLTRINGSEFSLNPDLIHRAEETPDTVLTLIDGSRYVVVRTLDELIDRIVGYRARVVAEAGRMAEPDAGHGPPPAGTAATTTARRRGGTVDPVRPRGRPRPDDSEGADVVRLRARRA